MCSAQRENLVWLCLVLLGGSKTVYRVTEEVINMSQEQEAKHKERALTLNTHRKSLLNESKNDV